MARVFVTKELSESIKSMRLQNKIAAKNLAEYIGKSPSFITKFEKGDINTIEEDELNAIFKFISNEDSSFDEIIEKIYSTLRFKYSHKEIEEQIWFANYDTVKRKIPIPNELIDEINNRMKFANITPEYLLSRINANESLTEEENNNLTIPYNTWWAKDKDSAQIQIIKIYFNINDLIDILNKKLDVSPYIFMLSIAFYLIKIETYKDQVIISEDENIELMKKASSLLNGYKYYSLAVKGNLISEVKSKEEQYELLSNFDKDNIVIVNNIIKKIKFLSDSNIKSTNNYLKQFDINLEWDMGFMIKLVSFQFESLGKLSYSQRKELLEKIDLLINEYKNVPEDRKRIETY